MLRRRELHMSAATLRGRVHGAQQARTRTARPAQPAFTPRGLVGAASTPEALATMRGAAADTQYAAKIGRATCARVPARTPCAALMSRAGDSAHARDTRKRTRSEVVRQRVGTHAAIAASGDDATSRKVATAPGVTPRGATGALSSAMRMVSGSAPPAYPSPPGIHPAHAALHRSHHEAGRETQAPPTSPDAAPHHWRPAIIEVTMRSASPVDADRIR